MGFSLVGFGAGLAESAIERIEEERKFSNLALQGRIERASVLKMQREKEAEALRKELLEQKASLQQFGIDDPEVQKAYLTAPTLAEALKKSLASGEVKTENANQYARQFANINKDKLQSGTVDEFIASATQAARGGGKVEPARVMPTEDGSMLAPSTSSQQRRLEQLASARGMSLEDLARAESPAAMSRPEPAASINLEMLRRPEKEDWKVNLTKYETRYANAAKDFGKDSPEALKALVDLDGYRAVTRNMTKDQFDHAKQLSKSLAIVNNPRLAQTLSPEEVEEAKQYIANDEARQRRLRDSGKDDEKIPSATSLVNIGRTAGASAVRKDFGTSAIKDNLVFSTNPDGSTSVQYTGRDQAAQQRIIRREQEAVVASMSMYMPDGRVRDKKVEQALSAFGITLDEQRRPVLISVPEAPPPKEAPSLPPRTPGAGRAGQAASTPTAKPATTATPEGFPPGSRIARNEFVEGKGYKVYNAAGKLIGYAQE